MGKEKKSSVQGVHYRTLGDFQLPSIVLLHGGGLSGRMWDEVALHLKDYHVIIPDLPGHGESSEIALSLEDCTQKLFKLTLEAANPDQPVHLVGLSLGGAIALHLMHEEPQRFSRVVISGTSSGLSRAEAFINNLNAPMYRWLPAAWLAALTIKSLDIPERFRSQLIQDTIPMQPATIKAMSRILMEFKLPQAPAPDLLVLVGEKETRLAIQSARKLCRQLHCEGRKVPRAGHAWNFQMPHSFAETVANWIEHKELTGLLQLGG
ncbi:alpha/beta fold hydrolase [Paenibacillus senegalensis]|uniref:alpha/beta fold hydrolase n=1 Tax=Paenibacillus senegalensis TaxID=1465766 RepID=UPI0002883475|nr:alpha/beta fold hydrolase [Paenibacillus senegalensis]